MAGHLELEGRLDRPFVVSRGGDQELSLLLTVRPQEVLRSLPGGVEVGANICLVFDVSQSMEEEGKLDAAIAAGRELIELAGPGAVISLVAFDEASYVLAPPTDGDQHQTLIPALEGLRQVGGGLTNITAGLEEGIAQLQAAPQEGRASVILLLSDGEDNTCKPDVIHAAVRAADANIQLFAVGMGRQYEADFLKALVMPSNGSLFGHADVHRVKEAFIDLAVSLANVVATQASLELELAPGVLVGKAYKASPDQLFLGHIHLGEDRRHTRRVGNIERSREYSFLFQLRAPVQGHGRLPLAHVRLRYDVPALGVQRAQVDLEVSVERTGDRVLAERQDGAVLECYRRVQITELVERFVDAHHAGRAEDTARYLDLLIRKYSDVNDHKMVNHYEDIRAELTRGGLITRAMINASVVASTVVRGGGELPVLVDDDF